tara:strand:- start:171 stop:755 length:585 start_codon:yes stop_codon:yes gene_type:complete
MNKVRQNLIWDPIVNLINKYVIKNSQHTTQSILDLQKSLDPVLSNYLIECNYNLPYGRYLVFSHKDGLFNIQIDIFSENYFGMIHSHSTWGILHVLKGKLYVEEWQEGEKNNYKLLGGLSLNEKSSQSFCPPISDWHKVWTSENKKQTASIHIYGEGFDIDKGTYLNKQFEPVSSNRSDFKDINEILPYCKYIG